MIQMPLLYLQDYLTILVIVLVYGHYSWVRQLMLPPLAACIGPLSTVKASSWVVKFQVKANFAVEYYFKICDICLYYRIFV